MKHNKQKGMTVLGALVTLALAGFFITAGLKVGPLYLDNSFIRAAMDSLANENVHVMTDNQVRGQLMEYLDVNNVRDIDRKDIKIEKE